MHGGLLSLEHNSPSIPADSPVAQLVHPRISEIAGGLIFCIQSHGRHTINISRTSNELRQLLSLLETGRFREVPGFANLPDDLLQLRGVVLGGTCDQAPNFDSLVQELNRIREMSRFPEYKMLLVTDGEMLDALSVQRGMDLFRDSDEIWIHLDCGALPYQARTEAPARSLANGNSPGAKAKTQRLETEGHRDDHRITRKILSIATRRPVVIQSAFYCLYGESPSESEVKNYIRHLKKLRRCGAQIALVQVCSPAQKELKRAQLKLKTLALIARRIREGTGLHTEFY